MNDFPVLQVVPRAPACRLRLVFCDSDVRQARRQAYVFTNDAPDKIPPAAGFQRSAGTACLGRPARHVTHRYRPGMRKRRIASHGQWCTRYFRISRPSAGCSPQLRLQTGGYAVRFGREIGRSALAHQQVIAKLCQGAPCDCGAKAPPHVVDVVAFPAGPGLKIGGKGVSHARYKRAFTAMLVSTMT